MVFSLANLLFILNVILINLWSLPMSAGVITSQFVTLPLLLHSHITFHPDQMKSVHENEANEMKLCLRPNLVTARQGKINFSESGANGRSQWYRHGRYEKVWQNSVHVMPKVQVFATQNSSPRSIWYSYGAKMDRKSNVKYSPLRVPTEETEWKRMGFLWQQCCHSLCTVPGSPETRNSNQKL